MATVYKIVRKKLKSSPTPASAKAAEADKFDTKSFTPATSADTIKKELLGILGTSKAPSSSPSGSSIPSSDATTVFKPVSDVKDKSADNTKKPEEKPISRSKNSPLESYVGSDPKTNKLKSSVGQKVNEIYGASKSDAAVNEKANEEDESSDEADRILRSVFGGEYEPKKKKDKNNKTSDILSAVKRAEESKPGPEQMPRPADAAAKAVPDISEIKAAKPDTDSADKTDNNIEKAKIISEPASEEKVNETIEDDSDYDDADEDTREKEPIDEFTAPEQYDELSETLKSRGSKMLLASLWTLLTTLGLIYLESACFTDIYHPIFLMPGKFGIVFLLIDLQLLFISALFILGNLADGVKALFKGKANFNSVTFAIMLTCVINVISNMIFKASSNDLMLYSTIGSLAAFCNALCSTFEAKRVYGAFRIVSAKKQKYIAKRLPPDCATGKTFSEYLPENPDIFSIEKTDFVDGFFKNLKAYPQSDSAFKISVPFSLIAGLIFAVVTFITRKSVPIAIDNFTLMVLMALPLGAVFVSVFPICALSKRAVKTETALIGLDSVEKYCNTAAVAFNDSEVFPSKGIKVTIVRAYGSHRIDKTILYAAKIFKKIGGPLATVFENSVSSIGGEITTDIEILEISPDGICAKIDGQEVFIGNKEYMLSYDFGYIKDQIDQVFENSVGRIMYMAIEDEIAAKFYIRYAISTGFEKLLRQLGSVGICASIRSCDPNIDNELLKHLLKKGDYPVGILKTPEAAKTHPVSPREDSGIVCTSTTANMLRGFILADKIKQRISANTLVKFISLLLGVFMVVFLYITGFSDKLDTFRMLLYHGLWLLPIIIPSLVE